MQSFFGSADIGLNHVQVMVRGMYALAQSDGVHATELVMLRDFYNACREDAEGFAEFDEVISQPLDLSTASEILDSDELRRAFLKSCFFLAYADGEYSDAEKKVIEGFGEALGVVEDGLLELKAEVTDHLIQQVARIKNLDALKDVAREIE